MSENTKEFLDDIIEELVECTKEDYPATLSEVFSHLDIKKLAYYFAYTNMEAGTELLDELLKYRELGRI